MQSKDRIRVRHILIENFWLERTNREAKSWMDHRDINMVMLATSLAPDGFLTL
jgi:hypothetical protein